MKPPIAMFAADVDERDVEAVAATIRRGGVMSIGPEQAALEKEFAAHTGTRHAVALNSGTAALHLIVRAMGLGKGDEVLVPAFTFIASVNALLYEDVTPVFVDIEPETFNLDPADVARKIGPKTKAIMPVDVFGHPADWDALTSLAGGKLKLIDDACEAIGSSLRGKRCGSFGDAGAFAFAGNKQLTTGEGGMLTTDDDDLARLARSMRNQGRGDDGNWFQHVRVGFNYRLPEPSCALALSQLRRMDELMARRQAVADRYDARLRGARRFRTPVVRDGVVMSWFVYAILLEPGLERAKVADALERRGIPTRPYFSPPVHLQPAMRERLGTGEGLLPVTEDVSRRTLALPFHGKLTMEEVDRVADELLDVTRA